MTSSGKKDKYLARHIAAEMGVEMTPAEVREGIQSIGKKFRRIFPELAGFSDDEVMDWIKANWTPQPE